MRDRDVSRFFDVLGEFRCCDGLVGDVVVTSGIDTIYPKGFVIGRVESVEKNGPAFKRIIVKPAVDFSQLEEVLVVLTPTPAKEAASGVSE